ncbi:MAG: HD domain-containing protein [Halobacteriaceae archaeon]
MDPPEWAGPGADHPLFRRVAGAVCEQYDRDSSGHDMSHAWRVLALGTRIADAEGADATVVGVAALVHDLHRAMGVAPRESLSAVEAALDAAGVPDEIAAAVRHPVAVHDDYSWEDDPASPDTAEAAVLRDADNLDAMGAVGVARTFAFAGATGQPFRAAENTPIQHFHDKLLRLRGEMHTEAARELAEERHAFLETFLDRFEREHRGER